MTSCFAVHHVAIQPLSHPEQDMGQNAGRGEAAGGKVMVRVRVKVRVRLRASRSCSPTSPHIAYQTQTE